MFSRVARFRLPNSQFPGLPRPRSYLALPTPCPGWMFLPHFSPLLLRLTLSLQPYIHHQPHFLLLFPPYAGFLLRNPVELTRTLWSNCGVLEFGEIPPPRRCASKGCRTQKARSLGALRAFAVRKTLFCSKTLNGRAIRTRFRAFYPNARCRRN